MSMAHAAPPLAAVLLLTPLVRPAPACAQWLPDGVALCTATEPQGRPAIVSDSVGGAIVTWHDYRSGDLDIYAQRITGSGVIAPGWTPDGVPLCTATGDQAHPNIVSDGAGGAIVIWEDFRNPTSYPDIYVQRIAASGTIPPGWIPDGVPLCTDAGGQRWPTIVPDGVGGAIGTWQDLRTGTLDVYAQRITASGTIAPGWTPDGVPLCTTPGNQQFPTIASDGAGGAIVAWRDLRGGLDTLWDIYAQRVTASGAIAPGWTADGAPLCTDPGVQGNPIIVSDGVGGAIVAWDDDRSFATTAYDLYAQRITASGTIATGWTSDGVPVSVEATAQINPTIASDGASGAILAWEDFRSGSGYGDIYAQRMTASGGIAPGWTLDGVPLCGAAFDQLFPSIIPDAVGGAIVTWDDLRSGANSDIYAQRVTDRGAIAPDWITDGVALCTDPADQRSRSHLYDGTTSGDIVNIAADGMGGAIVTWEDFRSAIISSSDLYAQRVTDSGVPGPVVDVPLGTELPTFQLLVPRPNPTGRGTAIAFELPSPRRITAGVFDVTGRPVRRLASGSEFPAGWHSLLWDGRDRGGVPVSNGVYLIRFQVENEAGVRRVTVVR